uniref:Post-GPI attachment to proteins factor 3 n=1 Tax=Caenorhabditis tropicalis TaxID=1561998 RepID=A0A1I7SZ34_9PELO
PHIMGWSIVLLTSIIEWFYIRNRVVAPFSFEKYEECLPTIAIVTSKSYHVV